MFKKFIAYILTVSVLLSMLVVNVSAAEEISNERVTKFENAVTLLTKIGAISEEDAFNFDSVISKGKFVDIMSKIVPVSNGSAVPVFADVPETHENYKVIQGFADAGYINGNGGTFEPDRDITYNEALYITMNTMGYKDFMAVVGAFPTGGWKIAEQLKIKMRHKGAVAGDIFYMLHQALVTDMLEITAMQKGSFVFSNEEGETLLEKYHEITNAEGVLQSNGDFSILSGDIAQSGTIVIDGVSYNTEDPCDILPGCTVDMFYNMESEELVCVLESADNTIVKVDARDIDGYYDRKYTYKEDGSKKSFKLSSDTIVVKNDKLVSMIPEGDLEAALYMEPVNGEVIAVHNGKGSGYDVVYIKEYISFRVRAVEKENNANKITIKAEKQYNIEDVIAYIETNATPVYNSEGNRVSAEDIAVGDIVSVMGNVVDGNIVAEEIVTSKDIVSGTLTTVAMGDEPYIVIDDVQYPVSNRVSSVLLNSVSPQMEMTFFVDFMGYIVALDDSISGSMAYGYLISIGVGTSEGEPYIIAKIFSEIGSIIKYKLSNKKLWIDRAFYKDTEPTQAAYEAILLKHFGTVNTTTLSNLGMLIRYDVNDDREINKIDLPRELSDTSVEPTVDDRLYMSVDNLSGGITGMTQFYGSKKAFGDKVHVDDDTLIFKLPDIERDEEESEYKIIRNIGGLKDGRYGVKAYKLGKDMMYAKVVVLRELLAPDLSSDHIGNMMVKKITRVLNEYGEETYSITLLGMNGEKTYLTKTLAVGDNPVDLNNEEVSSQNPPIVPGDIVRCYLTEDETSIAKIAICYNFRTAGLTESTKTSDWVSEQGTFGNGYVYAMDDRRIGIASGAIPSDATTVLQDNEYSTYMVDSYKIFKVETTGSGINRRVLDIVPATKKDLKSFKTNGENCSKVVAISSRGTGQLMFIIE